MTSALDHEYEDFSKYFERARYFLKNEEYQQAMKDFANAFESYSHILRVTENRKKSGSYDSSIRYNKDEISTCLVTLGSLFMFAIKCCLGLEKMDEIKFLCTKYENLISELSKQKDNLDIEDYKKLQDFEEDLIFFKDTLSGHEIISKDFVSGDPEFTKFQKSFNEICNLSICPLEPDYSTDSSCFIATAVYGTSNHTDLDTFRQFRNRCLLTSLIGKKLVDIYYRFGPKVALYVEQRYLIKGNIRNFLELLARLMRRIMVKEL